MTDIVFHLNSDVFARLKLFNNYLKDKTQHSVIYVVHEERAHNQQAVSILIPSFLTALGTPGTMTLHLATKTKRLGTSFPGSLILRSGEMRDPKNEVEGPGPE